MSTGLTVLVGIVLLWNSPDLGRGRLGRVLLSLAALGYVVAGLAPADEHENVHVLLGAVPIFFAGNLGLLLLGAQRSVLPVVRASALNAGLVGLTGTVLFLGHEDLGLGLGGMERIAALPLYAFLLAAGASVLLEGREHRRDAGGSRQNGRRLSV